MSKEQQRERLLRLVRKEYDNQRTFKARKEFKEWFFELKGSVGKKERAWEEIIAFKKER